MAIYAITWQLNSLQPHPEEQEKRIIEKIQTLPHYNDPDLKQVWFVGVSWKADRLYRYLYPEMEKPDRLLITSMGKANGQMNWKPLEAWQQEANFWIMPQKFDRKEIKVWREKQS